MTNTKSNNTETQPALIIQGGISIETKYLPATNHKGPRIKAFRTLKGTIRNSKEKTETLTVPYSYESKCPHEVAFEAWRKKYGSFYRAQKWVKGSTERGFIFTVIFD